MGRSGFRAAFAAVTVIAVGALPTSFARADFMQQGTKVVGSGATGGAKQGFAIALSADGNTLLSGGYADDLNAGAAWVFTRSGGKWTQQGGKLVGSGGLGVAKQGISVALSADGNTALIGGPGNNVTGGAWVFTRSGGTWTQQGAKLVGSGAVGGSMQGIGVALSADGNTAIVGGYQDNGGVGATWVFTRSGGVWTQQGSKLIGSGASGAAEQGFWVALSGDGNTALIGGPSNSSQAGATWVFTRSGAVWTQQGGALVGSGAAGAAQQGSAVALSTDGNTAIVGGPNDNAGVGASWIFTRSGSTWAQQGGKLVGTGGGSAPNQGVSVALSGTGDVAAVGGPGDSAGDGAIWAFSRSGGVWTQQGNKFVPVDVDAPGGSLPNIGFGVAIASDGLTIAAGGPGDKTNVGAAWSFVQQNASTPSLLVSILPTSRTVQVGTTATAFATVINTGPVQGTSCSLGFGPYVSVIPATFGYQTTNPATNVVTGAPNTPVNIPAGGNQSFVFALTPTGTFQANDVPIAAQCNNAANAPEVKGLTTLLYSASATPIPDIVALAASVTPGYVIIPGNTGTGAFSVAAVNVGATAQMQVKATTSGLGARTGSDPTFTLCQTNAQAQCINPTTPGDYVNLTIAANQTPTFSIFVKGTGPIPDNPAYNRVFVTFVNLNTPTFTGGGGSTSVAVKTQ